MSLKAERDQVSNRKCRKARLLHCVDDEHSIIRILTEDNNLAIIFGSNSVDRVLRIVQVKSVINPPGRLDRFLSRNLIAFFDVPT